VCTIDHKVGEIFVYPDSRGKICPAAMQVLYPYILGLQSGGSFPWEEEENSITICCPDYKNPVVFKLSRMEETITY